MVLKGDATDSEILKQGHLQHHIVTCLQSYAKAFVQHTADLLLLKRSISQISGNFCPTCLLGSSIRNQQKKNSVGVSNVSNDKGDKREERSELEARQCDTESPVPKTTPKLKGGPSAGSDFSKFYDAVGRDFESGAYGPRNE
uniref:DUF630 family protein n=1 Tax=Mesocestoides corti TaxID=53468 RepID=A0A5K3FPI5_MESCO